jgi:hypothetical protein
MRIIITDLSAVRQALVSDQILSATELPGIVSEASLIETIASLETANDKRHPDAMAQVSPRALVVALAVLKAVAK